MMREQQVPIGARSAIDDTVAARLYRNGQLEASAYFVLPFCGIITEASLTAISTKPTDPLASYTVEFEPVELWEIESL